MSPAPNQPHSGFWAAFTHLSFAASLAMVGLGILFLPVDWRSAATWRSG